MKAVFGPNWYLYLLAVLGLSMIDTNHTEYPVLSSVIGCIALGSAACLRWRRFVQRRTVVSEFKQRVADFGAGTHLLRVRGWPPVIGPLLAQPVESSGIAVSVERRRVVLMQESRVKEYAVEDIREWSISHVASGQLVSSTSDVVQAAALGGANAGMAIRANQQSGIFVRVKDIDAPEWQINTTNKKLMLRWSEILKQLTD